MKKEEIKSLLKNKANSIYLIVIVISFLLLNIVLNIPNLIGKYYDNLIEKDIYATMEQARLDLKTGNLRNDLGKNYTDYNFVKNNYKMILISDSITNTESKISEILKEHKYVEDIRVEKLDFSIDNNENIIDFIYIDVDDWKHCIDVKNFLDDKGIETSYCVNEEYYDNYNTAITFGNVIKYFSIVICVFIIVVSCNNIIKNEYEHLKLLNILGYNKKRLSRIIIFQLLFVTLIGLIIGIILSRLSLYMLCSLLRLNDFSNNIVRDLIINLCIIIMDIFLIKNRAINKLN